MQQKNEQARIVISWNPVNDPNLLGYLVLRSQSTQGPFTPVTSDTLFTTGQTAYVDSLVTTDQVYFYKVQTVVQDPQLGLLRSDTSTFIDGQALADQSAPGAPLGSHRQPGRRSLSARDAQLDCTHIRQKWQ